MLKVLERYGKIEDHIVRVEGGTFGACRQEPHIKAVRCGSRVGCVPAAKQRYDGSFVLFHIRVQLSCSHDVKRIQSEPGVKAP